MKFRMGNARRLLGLTAISFFGFGNHHVSAASELPFQLAQFSPGESEIIILDETDHSQHVQPVTSPTPAPEATPTHHGGDAGMFMIEYRFMSMFQQGLLEGTKSITPETVLQQAQDTGRWVDANGEPLMSIGTEMTMNMHMFMVMYAPTDKLTLMAMSNILSNSMTMLMLPMNEMGDNGLMPMQTITEWSSMEMASSGLGDTQVALTYKLDDYVLFDPLLTVGVNLPTGDIDQADATGVLPYDMQLGSGTYDFLIGYGMGNMWESWHFGADARYLWRSCDNVQGYNLGDRYSIEGYIKYHLSTGTTLRASVKHETWDKVQGRDLRIDDNPNYYGGMRSDMWVGVKQELFFGLYADFHFGFPLHQKLDEVQMKTDWQMQAAVGWMWM